MNSKIMLCSVFCVMLSLREMSYVLAVGKAGVDFLNLPIGARAVGMGEAAAAITTDATALYWNPAGLGRMKHRSLTLMHYAYVQGVSEHFLGFAWPFKSVGTFGLSYIGMNAGNIDEIDEYGLPQNRSFSPSGSAIGIGLSRNIGDRFSAGAHFKFVTQKVINSGSTLTLDIGGSFHTKQWSAGVSAHNLFGSIKLDQVSDPLPFNIRLGGGYRCRDEWLIATDFNVPLYSSPYAALGIEYNWRVKDDMALSGRLGINTRTVDLGLFSLGVGFRFRSLAVDIALSPKDKLGDPLQISTNFKF